MTKPNFKIKSIAVALLAISTLITACDNANALNDQVEVQHVAPLSISVKEYKLFNDKEGRAVIQLDGYFVEVNFTYEDTSPIESQSDIQIDNLVPVTTYDAKFNLYEVDWDQSDIQVMVAELKTALRGV
ncbi:hypothetical protein [Acinetobacter wanghuae]|uniref:hypothetical protein n=1 Tax=Acinetobacter wanghuae TaxID=2662362 RepID=UPI003AF51D9E